MLKKLIILFAMVGVCSFIAANLYSNTYKNSSAVAAENDQSSQISDVSAKTSLDIAKTKELASTNPIKISVPEGAVDVKPVIYGDLSAPVIIEEFASFTCSHCADFYRDKMPKLKAALIDNGLAQLHLYSVVGDAQGLEATMIVQCQEDNEKRKKFTSAIMTGMEQWAYSTNYQNGLRTIAKLGGMPEEEYNKCVEDKKIEEAIIKSRQWFDKQVKITATPYFRIGSQALMGAQTIEAFEKAIQAELQPENKPDEEK